MSQDRRIIRVLLSYHSSAPHPVTETSQLSQLPELLKDA